MAASQMTTPLKTYPCPLRRKPSTDAYHTETSDPPLSQIELLKTRNKMFPVTCYVLDGYFNHRTDNLPSTIQTMGDIQESILGLLSKPLGSDA